MQVEIIKQVGRTVKEVVASIINKRYPEIKAQVLLQSSPSGDFDYSSPSAMKEFNVHKNKKEGHTYGAKSVQQLAKEVCTAYYNNPVIESLSVTQKGFLLIRLQNQYIADRVNQIVRSIDFPSPKPQKVVVDFSSPNVAKEMHVGHLRSTIIGESICRMLEFRQNEVIRANHIGDWGTQFGMLIAFMRVEFPDYETNFPDISDLDAYYKLARQRFDKDLAFKKQSRETVVRLQAYGAEEIKIWKMICQVSRDYFNKIYALLKVNLQEFGESFYNPFIPAMLQELHQLGLIKEDDTQTKKGLKVQKAVPAEKGEENKQKTVEKKDKKKQQKKEEKQEKDEEQQEKDDQEDLTEGEKRKAQCIFLQKFTIPLIVVKSDGGYNYDTTDMAAIKYRLQIQKADRAIYITDLGQKQHFQMIFAAARKAGWLTTQRYEHMGFGCMLGQDKKKFKTRQGKTIKLLLLLNEAKQKALNQLKSREKVQKLQQPIQEQVQKEANFTSLKPEEFENAAQKLGIASIKYFDLKQNRLSDYVFSFQKMLDPKGNTAVYLIYAYVRISSILRKSGLTSEQIQKISRQKPFVITHPDERCLAAMLIKFFDVVEDCIQQLQINKLTDFIYEICVKVQQNYKRYRILGDENMHTRIVLCEAIRKVLEKSFYLLGIEPIDRI